MKSIHALKELFCHPPIRAVYLPWLVVFVILMFANTQDGGPNAVSRFLTMRAMSEEGTFTIDKRIGASMDWSQTPDGHYYSNKAPGPMLLGFPTFFVIDQFPRFKEKGFRDEHGHRHTPGYFQKTYTSFFNQILPFLVLALLLVAWMGREKISVTSQIAFLLAAFFGSTVSLYFNNYSGHAFQAVLQLALLYSLIRGRFAWAGFLSGAALLSDYSFVMQLPAFLLVLFMSWRLRASMPQGGQSFFALVKSLSIGALIPGALWVWYHTAAFGSPFKVANHFQNPVFQDTAQEKYNLLGIFKLPDPVVFWELLFGPARGLLVTQPWILFLLALFFWRILPRAKSAVYETTELALARKITPWFCGLSLLALLVMNAAYGGWLGGGAAGPRYLSGIFLCFAFWLALELDRIPKAGKMLLLGGLAVALVFRALVYGSTILGPGTSLWTFYLGEFLKTSKTPYLRTGIFMVLVVIGFVWQRKSLRKLSAS